MGGGGGLMLLRLPRAVSSIEKQIVLLLLLWSFCRRYLDRLGETKYLMALKNLCDAGKSKWQRHGGVGGSCTGTLEGLLVALKNVCDARESKQRQQGRVRQLVCVEGGGSGRRSDGVTRLPMCKPTRWFITSDVVQDPAADVTVWFDFVSTVSLDL